MHSLYNPQLINTNSILIPLAHFKKFIQNRSLLSQNCLVVRDVATPNSTGKISILKGVGTNKRMQTITQHSFYYLPAQIVVKRSIFVCFERNLQIRAEICFGEYMLEILVMVYGNLSLVVVINKVPTEPMKGLDTPAGHVTGVSPR